MIIHGRGFRVEVLFGAGARGRMGRPHKPMVPLRAALSRKRGGVEGGSL